MNRVEKEIAQAQLQAEERTLTELKVIFNKAKADVQHRISELNTRQEMQDLQSIVYQKKYQEAILKQIESTLQELQSGEYKTAEQFLHDSYDNGYIGMMYSLQNQGIPMTIPIDDRKVVRALTTDSQLVRRYYEADPLKGRLAENYDLLKTRVRTNLSRGVAQGQSWLQVATNIATGMNNPFDIAFRDAMRIVRTEGHRVNQQGFIDAGDEAKKKGADIVKQWDATLDSKTRPAHQEADGQIQEWDDDFIVGGEHLKAPSIGGSAWNVINCRCQLLQRAKWALNEAELKTLEDRAKFFDLDKSDSFKDFKEKYLKLPEKADTMVLDSLKTPVVGTDEHYQKSKAVFERKGVKYVPVERSLQKLTEEEIIKTISGSDRTSGSCASVGMAYIGQKLGYNVHDFRGGSSMEAFRSWENLRELVQMSGMNVLRAKGASSLTVANRLLNQVEVGKEYYLCAGKHASIVRKTEKGILQYLELQGDYNSSEAYNKGGWHDFTNPYNLPIGTTVKETLKWRFGCTTTSNPWHEKLDFMIDLEESSLDTEEFRSILGYINTTDGEEKKGAGGSIK